MAIIVNELAGCSSRKKESAKAGKELESKERVVANNSGLLN